VDDDNYWVVGTTWVSGREHGAVFGMRDGDWKLSARMSDGFASEPVIRVLDDETVVVGAHRSATRGAHPKVYVVDGGGTTAHELAKPSRASLPSGLVLAPTASDTFYVLTWEPPLRIASGGVTHLREGRDEAFWVHDPETNSPLKYPIYEILASESFEPGQAYGLWTRRIGRDAPPGSKPMIIEHRENGLWYRLDELPFDKHDWIRCVWFGRAESDAFCVIGGLDGTVYVHHIGGETVEQSVDVIEDGTIGDLCAVWGVNPDEYWVMDNTGTVWQRSDNRWESVIRGMDRDNVTFEDAWVSPAGNIYAVSADALFRLPSH
jgi:hypothetical protein